MCFDRSEAEARKEHKAAKETLAKAREVVETVKDEVQTPEAKAKVDTQLKEIKNQEMALA